MPEPMPSNQDAERALLSAILQRPDVLADAQSVTPEDFYVQAHGTIYAAVRTILDSGRRLEAVTLAEELHRIGRLDDVGGPAYLGDILDYSGHASGVPAYVETILELSRKRRLIRDLTDAVQTAYSPGATSDDVTERAFSALLTHPAGGTGPQQIGETARFALHDLERRTERKRAGGCGTTARPTGFLDLDRLIVGIEPGTYNILAGRPSMGKTAFAMAIAGNVCDAGGRVCVFSMETLRIGIATRLLSERARVPLMDIRTAELRDEHWQRLSTAMNKIAEWDLWVDDGRGLTPAQVGAAVRRLQATRAVDLIVVDYLQLMRAPGRSGNRTEAVGAISMGLQELSGTTGAAVLALSQLNRGVESRTDKRPMLMDLRESGQIEQDADLVAFIYRDAVYNPGADKHRAEIIIAKQRNGPCGTVDVHWDGPCAAFGNLGR